MIRSAAACEKPLISCRPIRTPGPLAPYVFDGCLIRAASLARRAPHRLAKNLTRQRRAVELLAAQRLADIEHDALAKSARRFSSTDSQSLKDTSGAKHLDAVTLRVLHELRRRVKPIGWLFSKRGQKRRRLVALEPRADIHEQREARRMALRKTVFAEALDLLEDALRRNPARSRARACRSQIGLIVLRGRLCVSTRPSRAAAGRPRRP